MRSVTRDGATEPYSLQSTGGPVGRGGVRIRIGDADVVLEPGIYRYTIEYEIQRWITFGETEDQLYWNVTGNGWGFPIRSAMARIRIPELGAQPTLESWTGPEGSTETSARWRWDAAAKVAEFRTDETLEPGDGLTVSVTFPSGHLTPPSERQQAEWFALDWGGSIDAGYAVLFVIGMYLLMWRRVGVDPMRGPTPLRREPPPGYSPAELGYIEQRGYDKSQLSAALVSIAMKGAMRIQHNGGSWTLHKVDGTVDPAREERALIDSLLGSRDLIRLEQGQHTALRAAIKTFKRSLSRQLEREYFETNRRWFGAGLVISIVGFLALTWRWTYAIEPAAIFLGVWLTGWSVGVATLVYRWVQTLRVALAGGGVLEWISTGFLALFSIPFLIAEVVVAGILFTMVPSHLVFAAIAIGTTNVVFYHLLERPTMKGRGVLDHVDGFRAYVTETEERRLPQSTDRIELFERLLPFAIALGLELRWAEAFGNALQPPMEPGPMRETMPWYDHDEVGFDPASFVSSLGAGLSTTLSASSSPPGSSGGGGGGSSGGGGGAEVEAAGRRLRSGSLRVERAPHRGRK